MKRNPLADLDRGPVVSRRGNYKLFAFALGCWFCSWGMQMVLFSWLVVGELNQPAEAVGTAMMALVVPALFFLLIGGTAADRLDRRRLLAAISLAAAVAVAALTVAVGLGSFTFLLLIGYALVMGTLNAFAFPARDALLVEVAGPNLLRAVTGATMAQFAAQSLGSLAAGGVARLAGAPLALALQSAVLLTAVPALLRLPRARRSKRRTDPIRPAEVLEGLREVLHSPVMLPVMLLGVGIGLFFMGPYTVLFPLLIRDVFHGDVADLGFLQMTFPVGAVLASLWLVRRGHLRRKGRVLVRCQVGSALCLLTIASGIPFAATLVAGLGWGLCGGVFMSTGRTLFQETAAETHRARVLSVYTLSFMGSGALGSPLAGYLAGQLGAQGACTVAGVCMLVFVATVAGFSKLLELD